MVVSVACDFEADFCEWSEKGWSLQIGKGNNPSKDHTTDTETGLYIIFTVNMKLKKKNFFTSRKL